MDDWHRMEHDGSRSRHLLQISFRAVLASWRAGSSSFTVKDRKEVLREFLRVSAENLQQTETSDGGLTLFGRAITEESVLSQKVRAAAVPDLPEKLFTATQAIKRAEKQRALSEQHTESFASDLFQEEDNI